MPISTISLQGLTPNISGTGPAFFVLPSAGLTVTLATATKIQLNTEEFDTNSNYDTSTYRFTPTVAGYYQISAGLRATALATAVSMAVFIYKNGSPYVVNYSSSSALTQYPVVSSLVYMNGSTDYVEFYGIINGTGTASFGTTANGAYATWASGCLVRSA